MFFSLIKSDIISRLSVSVHQITRIIITFGRLYKISVFETSKHHRIIPAIHLENICSKMNSDPSGIKIEISSGISELVPTKGCPDSSQEDTGSRESILPSLVDKESTDINLEGSGDSKLALKKTQVKSGLCAVVSATESDGDGRWKSVGTQCCGSSDDDCIVVYKQAWSEGEEEMEEVNTVLTEVDETGDQQQLQDKEGPGAAVGCEKRKASEDIEPNKDLKKAKLETKALKAKRPGFTDDRYNETSYYIENGLRKVYPYYFTFTTFTKGRWVGEKILDVFAREFRAHPAEEYERCIRTGSLTVNYEKVDVDYRLKHNDLLANIVHRHEAPVLAKPLRLIHVDDDIVVLDKPCSLPVHPCGRYRHNTVVFILAKEYHLKNLRTIHRLDRLTSGLLLFGRTPKKARQMEHQIRNRQVQKEYVCRVEGEFPDVVECAEPIEVVSYKIGVCKVSPKGKECNTTFQRLGYNPETNTSVVLCLPHTGRMHQIRVHLQYLGYPVVNDPLYNHLVFGPEKGRGGNIGKSDEDLIRDLISIHNAENWLGMDGDSDLSMFKPLLNYDDDDKGPSREPSPCEGGLPPPPPLPCPRSSKVTVATQTGHEAPDLAFHPDKLTSDPHCYECKVKYRDPKPRDLVMYLHAWKYRGPGWSYQTELPEWARIDWVDTED